MSCVRACVSCAAGEKLITKGEYATFCGIVLQGTFSAIVTPTFTVALGPGDMVGEMSLVRGHDTHRVEAECKREESS